MLLQQIRTSNKPSADDVDVLTDLEVAGHKWSTRLNKCVFTDRTSNQLLFRHQSGFGEQAAVVLGKL